MPNKPITIALPCPGFFPNLGGAEIGLHNIAKRFKQRGHRPVVMSSWSHVQTLRKNGVEMPYEVVALPPFTLGQYKNYQDISQFVLANYYALMHRRYQFDVAHINYTFPTGVSFIRWQQKTRTPIPFLIQSVGDDIQKQPEIGYGMRLDPMIDHIVHTWLPKAPMVTAVSESVHDEFLSIGIPEDKIRMVPYGVDAKRFGGHTPTQSRSDLFDCGDETFVFLCVGRNHPKKNFQQPLRAAAELCKEGRTNFKLVYVGTAVDTLSPEVEKLGLGDHVILRRPPPLEKNKYDNIPADGLLDYYHRADCFLMPSITETFGIVTAEAMASGLPVISANTPGCRDVTDNGAYALTYELSDDATFLSHMKTMMDSQEIRRKYSQLSKDRAQVFDWEVITDKYLACYDELMAR